MINTVTISGRVAAEPKVTTFNNSIKATFTLISTEVYYDRGGNKRESVNKVSVEAWGSLAENVIQVYLGTGKHVIVTGSLASSSWQGEDGQWQRRNYVKAAQIELLGEPRLTERAAEKSF